MPMAHGWPRCCGYAGTPSAQPDDEQLNELQTYQEELNGLFERLQARTQQQDPGVASAIRAAIEPRLPEALRGESLSRLAMAFVASTAGVTCVLNGMREPAYVADAVGVMGLPAVPEVEQLAAAFD
jgi:aryl-alcohol dehydrogenase-like predicted oxidoreductase